MVLKLYGHPWSSYTQRVMVLLEETNTPHEFIQIDLATGKHKEPAYLALAPFGQVPAMDDDGFILSESRAICKYLAAKLGSPLVPPPQDAARVAMFEQALSIEQSNFDVFVEPIVAQRVFAPMFGGPTDDALMQKLATALEGKLAGYENILARQRYLAGDALTLADLYHLPLGHYLAPLGHKWLEDPERFPHVARWWAEISARPSWQKVKKGSPM